MITALADFRGRTALLIGGEAEGISPEGQQLATHSVRIPMTGKTESLNAAVSASVLMFEVLRQRSQKVAGKGEGRQVHGRSGLGGGVIPPILTQFCHLLARPGAAKRGVFAHRISPLHRLDPTPSP